MKICTYNIWNSEQNFNQRLKLLLNELNGLDIDILALQEVKSEEVYKHLLTHSNFKYGEYFDGLAILSKTEIRLTNKMEINNSFLMRVVIDGISITNVHFDWENKSNRTLGLDSYFDMIEEHSLDTEILLGDFNDVPEEQLHYELINCDFLDIHQRYAHSKNQLPLPTLDIINNPRWRDEETSEVPCRFDWIMLNTINQLEINNVSLIGVNETKGLTPSDHYGVLTDISIQKS